MRPILQTIKDGNIAEAKRLINEKLIDLDRDGGFGLNWSAYFGRAEFIKLLIDNGVDVSGYEGQEALKCACSSGCVDVIKVLLDAGVDVHTAGDYGLRWASLNGKTSAVTVLLEAGADVHSENDAPLIWAHSKNHIGVMIKLVKAGADISKVDWEHTVGRFESIDDLIDKLSIKLIAEELSMTTR